ncbi:hypothetical protein [Yersinia hibernica]|uniref:hypothetical protein n=1 Tax=Yersinia hibernica TaxID=2339259 RepID=UPI001FE93A33|nr:hypothetical protein [Yersinia hibernica]
MASLLVLQPPSSINTRATSGRIVLFFMVLLPFFVERIRAGKIPKTTQQKRVYLRPR